MTAHITPKNFTTNLLDLLDETFENHHGIYLDRGTSLYDTLATISATEASIPVSATCATLAAQVAHVIYYMEVLERYILKQEVSNVDWGEVWRTVKEVTPAEWDASQHKLKATYQRIMNILRQLESWDDEDTIGGALAIVVHTAYHLGEIRQALCTLKQPS
jgi:hypothetical protein